jgi:hypothetical protein
MGGCSKNEREREGRKEVGWEIEMVIWEYSSTFYAG